MKEIYEKMEIDIELLSVLDVITTSAEEEGTDPTDPTEPIVHENAYINFDSFADEDSLSV